ncbi:hypothetical protein Tco_0017843 [Tanacetum coccineum]
MDMFCDTLKLLVETPDNLFFVPATIEIIKSFMNRVGYQGVVDKVSAFFTKNLAQPWQTMFKKNAIQYPRFTKLIIADLMKKFSSISSRIEEDYHSIKDDILLIRVTNNYKEYETVFVNVAVPTNQPQPLVSTQGTHRSTPRAHRKPTLTTASPQGKKRKQSAGETIRIEPESHKEHLEVVVDDDDNNEEKKDEKEGGVMGSLEIRTEKMQIPIPTTPRSPRINVSSNKNIAQELTDIVSISTPTTSKDSHKKRRISSKYSHLPGALHRMCKRQGNMIRAMEGKCVTTDEFWKVHKKFDQVLHEIVAQLAERATYDFIENNLKPCIAETIIEDHDAFLSEVPNLISQEFNAYASNIIEELFKNYVQTNMKSNIQDQANDPTLWDVLKRKFEKPSTSKTSCKEDDFYSHHDDHQEDDSPPEGEKRVKRQKASKKEKVIAEDEVIPEDETPELIIEFQNVDKRVPTIFDRARMKATLNDMLSNQFRNAKEYAYHLEQATNFMENKIVWESRQADIRRPVPKPLVFFGPQRNPNEPPRYNKDLFFLKNENTEEKKYILSLHKIHAERSPEADLEEKNESLVRNRELSNQGHFNPPTLTFPSIEEYEPYSIVDKPTTGLIYLNNKDEKRVMYLVEIVKFYDATLENVLKEVKLKIFQSEP